MLTKAEAIRNHRLMWNWIAQTSIQEQRCAMKWEAIVHFGWPDILSNCWCCEYTEAIAPDSWCGLCPVVWAGITGCYDCNSEFKKWKAAVNSHNYILAAKYAYMIAELPERR